MFEDFYIWKIEALDKEWLSHFGFETNDEWLFSFWNDPTLGLSKKMIKRLKLDIKNKENVWKLIKNYFKFKKSL